MPPAQACGAKRGFRYQQLPQHFYPAFLLDLNVPRYMLVALAYPLCPFTCNSPLPGVVVIFAASFLVISNRFVRIGDTLIALRDAKHQRFRLGIFHFFGQSARFFGSL